MEWSSRQKLSIALLILLALLSWVSWQILERAVLVEGASNFMLPSLTVLGMLLLLFAGSIVWQELSFRWLAASFLVLPSMLVTLSWSHGIMMLVALGLVYVGLSRIQEELRERIHLAIRKSIWLGSAPLLLAMSLLLSSQYYAHVSQLSWDRLVPSFNLAEGIGPLMIRLITPFYPDMQKLSNTQVTVDEFLEEVQTKERSTWETQIPVSLQQPFLQHELHRTKSEFSRLLGREISGDESMQALVAEIIEQKTLSLLVKEQPTSSVPILPLVLTALLFLTVYPIMTFLAPLVTLVAILLFRLARFVGWISIQRASVEREWIVA